MKIIKNLGLAFLILWLTSLSFYNLVFHLKKEDIVYCEDDTTYTEIISVFGLSLVGCKTFK